MRKTWLIADSVISPLGITSAVNYQQISDGESSIKQVKLKTFGEHPVCISHLSDLVAQEGKTRFELLATQALDQLKQQVALPNKRTLFVLSSTKGNIEVLENKQRHHARIHLHAVASYLAKQVAIEKSIVVSTACASGIAALLVAKRYIERGGYDHAIVLGVDVLSNFVISGFGSLQALSPIPCKPFDADRSGINLGEAASAAFLTAKLEEFESQSKVAILGGGTTNDANHISGPSKTGEELAIAIGQALAEANVTSKEIDFISAHGTATLYNDEMEAKAFSLLKMNNTPLHSLKGNFGHTLGGAGVVEAVMCAHSLQQQQLIPTCGFTKPGVSQQLNIIEKKESKTLRFALKTASGFGGCNAALVLSFENG